VDRIGAASRIAGAAGQRAGSADGAESLGAAPVRAAKMDPLPLYCATAGALSGLDYRSNALHLLPEPHQLGWGQHAAIYRPSQLQGALSAERADRVISQQSALAGRVCDRPDDAGPGPGDDFQHGHARRALVQSQLLLAAGAVVAGDRGGVVVGLSSIEGADQLAADRERTDQQSARLAGGPRAGDLLHYRGGGVAAGGLCDG